MQENAMKAWEAGDQLRELLEADARVQLTDEDLDRCFDPDRFLANAGVVFERLSAVALS
ncbi:MAG: hypothetical protein ACRDWH_00420 [Acidimicrobiia bacterium]